MIQMVMLLVTIGWGYTVLMMALAEASFIAGIMTFLLYCVVPLSVILYLFDTPRRRRVQSSSTAARHSNSSESASDSASDSAPDSTSNSSADSSPD
jgi:hypothetical protein